MPESLAQRVIDGPVIPWEVVPAIKAHELVKYHTEIPGSPALYVATFLLAMNTAKYELLPDLKAVIDTNAGMAAAEMAGPAWDAASAAVEDMVTKRASNEITTLLEDEKETWAKLTQPVTERWLAAMKEKGQDGTKLLDEAKALLAKYAKV